MNFCGSYLVTPEQGSKKPKNPDFSVPRGLRTEQVVPFESPCSIGQILPGLKKIEVVTADPSGCS